MGRSEDNSRQLIAKLGYCCGMPTQKTKNGFEPRICERCGLKFEWRKKWAKDWETVKYCSKKCKG